MRHRAEIAAALTAALAIIVAVAIIASQAGVVAKLFLTVGNSIFGLWAGMQIRRMMGE